MANGPAPNNASNVRKACLPPVYKTECSFGSLFTYLNCSLLPTPPIRGRFYLCLPLTFGDYHG